jgi:inorganic triphosphatase YgiF
MHEIELKLVVPAEARAAVLRELRRGKLRQQTLRARYFDTADDALARHAVALRLRQEGRRWVQTAKAASPDPLLRFEHEVELPLGRAPVLDPRRHQGSPADRALQRALQASETAALAMRFATDVKRLSRTVRSHGARIELAFDEGSVRAGERAEPICELELELKGGPATAVPAAAAAWIERHGLWVSTATKAERGGRLARAEAEAPPVGARPVAVDPDASAPAFLGAVLGSCLEQVLGNAGPVAAGAGGDELIHQLRVGLRRLRTALRELGTLADPFPPKWEDVLSAAFQELGAHRDTALVVPTIAAELARAGAPELEELPKVRARSPQTVVRDPAFQRTLLEILGRAHALSAAVVLPSSPTPNPSAPRAAVASSPQRDEAAADGSAEASSAAAEPDPDPVAAVSPGSARAVVAQHLQTLHKQLVRDAKRFTDLDTPRQHRVRKRLKRLRYLAEFAAALFGAKRVSRYLGQWKAAQDELGAYNDARIAVDAYRGVAERQPAAWFAVGWLEAGKDRSVKRCARALRAACKSEPFWS